MEDKQNEGSSLPISTILVAIAVIGGIWFYVKPLKSTRPIAEPSFCCDEKVQARLWQDPFDAVKKHKEEKNTDAVPRRLSTTGIHGEIREIIGKKHNKVTVLVIMVPGGPYSENVEFRLRMRYAAVSALARLDYTPDGPQHIDYFECTHIEAGDTCFCPEKISHNNTEGKKSCDLTVPFEWFSQTKKDNKEGTKENNEDKLSKVLLLWLNDDKFQSDPLKKLSNLVGKIKIKVEEESGENGNGNTVNNDIGFKIMGPAGSTNLVSMIKECKGCNCVFGDYNSFQIYSPFATADRSLLYKEALSDDKEKCDKEKCEKNKDINISSYISERSRKKIKLLRTIGTDKDLCDSLIKELKLRRAGPAEDYRNHIALISEWDTFYGRFLPETFVKSVAESVIKSGGKFHRKQFKDQKSIENLCKAIKDSSPGLDLNSNDNTLEWLNKLCDDGIIENKSGEIPEENPSKSNKNNQEIAISFESKFLESITSHFGKQLHRFSYLRGIDGQLPGDSQSDSDKQEAREQTKEQELEQWKITGNMRRSNGRNQFDYLIRLTKQIQMLNNDLLRKGNGKLTAIGILGSDVYDKLLILQAMRPYFPEVVFFTTDLDARLLHSDELKWTRNLVVASNFGFRLHDDIQGAIPAFRDNYQTSLFFSTILALTTKDEIFENKDTAMNFLQPRIFEIGRRSACDITVPTTKEVNENHLITLGFDEPIGIEPSTLYPKSDIAVGREYFKFFTEKYFKIIGVAFLVVLFASLYMSSDTVKKFLTFTSNSEDSHGSFVKLIILSLLGIVIIFIVFNICENLLIEEPFSLFNGVSIWPTEILRLLSSMLSMFFVFLIWRNIEDANENISEHYSLPKPARLSTKLIFSDPKFPYFWWFKNRRNEKKAGCFDDLWKCYLSLGSFKNRAMRAIIQTALFLVSGALILMILEYSGYGLFIPARGDFSFSVDFVILKCISVPSMLFLTFFIVDQHRLFRRLIQLGLELEEKCLPKVGISCRVHAHQRILMLAEYTEHIKYSNVYSFIVLFLMIIARSCYFDNWNTNFGLLVIFVALGMYSFACTIILHQKVKECKNDFVTMLKKEIVCLHTKILKANSVVYEEANFEMEHIKSTINAIESIRKGAFRPLIQHPLFQAALLPIGGTGSLLFINFFT